jgi:hypothetical protein
MLHLDTSRSAAIVNSQAAVTKENGNPFQCSIFIQDEYRNVRQVELETAEIPHGFYNIRSPLNTFIVDGKTFTITPGNYTIDTLLTAMNSASGATFTKVGDKITTGGTPAPSASLLYDGTYPQGPFFSTISRNGGTVVVYDNSYTYIYRKTNGSWNREFTSLYRVYPLLAATFIDVSDDGNTVIQGSDPNNPDNTAYIFTRNIDGSWSTYTISRSSTNAFGGSVALSGDGNTAIISSITDNQTYVYTYSGGSWSCPNNTYTPFDCGDTSHTSPQYYAISSDGKTFIGAQNNSPPFLPSVFTKNSDGTWNTSPDVTFQGLTGTGDYWGQVFCISSDGRNVIIVDASNRTVGLYSRDSNWNLQHTFNISGAGGSVANIGISNNGNRVFIQFNGDGLVFTKQSDGSWISSALHPTSLSGASTAPTTTKSLSGDGNTALVGTGTSGDLGTYYRTYVYTINQDLLTCPPNSLLSLLGFTDGQTGTATNSYIFPFDDYINIWIENVGASSQEFQQITYKIPVTAGTTYWTNNDVNKQIVKNRSYDFPLSKLNIKVLDRFGNQLDNNGQDWSFSIRTSAESP